MTKVTSVLQLSENSCDEGNVISSRAVTKVTLVLDLAENIYDEGNVISSPAVTKVTSVLDLAENSCDEGNVISPPAVAKLSSVLHFAENRCDEGNVISPPAVTKVTSILHLAENGCDEPGGAPTAEPMSVPHQLLGKQGGRCHEQATGRSVEQALHGGQGDGGLGGAVVAAALLSRPPLRVQLPHDARCFQLQEPGQNK